MSTTTNPNRANLKLSKLQSLLDEERLIAADRDSVVTDLIDAIEGEATTEPISKQEDYAIVMSQSKSAIEGLQTSEALVAGEWFAHVPSRWVGSLENHWTSIVVTISTFSTCLRIKVLMRSKQQVEFWQLVETHTMFTSWLQCLTTCITEEASKYELAARMLQFPNAPLAEIPAWVHPEAASFSRMNVELRKLLGIKSLINEALGDEIFRDIIDGIRDDEDAHRLILPKMYYPISMIRSSSSPG